MYLFVSLSRPKSQLISRYSFLCVCDRRGKTTSSREISKKQKLKSLGPVLVLRSHFFGSHPLSHHTSIRACFCVVRWTCFAILTFVAFFCPASPAGQSLIVSRIVLLSLIIPRVGIQNASQNTKHKMQNAWVHSKLHLNQKNM